MTSAFSLSNSMDCSLPGSSVHGIFLAKILAWAAIPSSTGSSWPRDQTRISISCTAGRFVTGEPPGKQIYRREKKKPKLFLGKTPIHKHTTWVFRLVTSAISVWRGNIAGEINKDWEFWAFTSVFYYPYVWNNNHTSCFHWFAMQARKDQNTQFNHKSKHSPSYRESK